MNITRDESVRGAHARDASGLELVPDAVARTSSVDDVVAIVREASGMDMPITPAGSQTSTTAASITDRGLLLSLRGMDRIIDIDPAAREVRVGPGVLIGALNRELASIGLQFAPDPTSEEEATIGGAVACNASGARSFRYGATRAHVRGLTVVTAAGETVRFRRPKLEKNTVGYAAAHDPVDWFVGSEGTLGIVVEAELGLVPLPARTVGLAIPFDAEDDALRFIVAARELGSTRQASIRAQCLEFFDAQALGIARQAADDTAWASGAGGLVYLEQTLEESDGGDAALDVALDGWLALADEHQARSSDIRVYEGVASLREARRLRHAVPARMNERGASRRPHGGRKVSTDWAVPYHKLGEALAFAHAAADRAGIERAVTYGHAGNGHPHQNFIAHDADELRRIDAVVEETIRCVLALGGTVAAEHGLGKLKRKWLSVQLSALQVAAMRGLKHALDPRGLLAPGNVL